MNIQELRRKFEDLDHIEVFKDTKWEESAKLGIEEDVKLSIQFAIEMLEEIILNYLEDTEQEDNFTEWGLGYQQCSLDAISGFRFKIEELKKYL